MSTTPDRPADQSGWYRVRLKGHLAPRWTARFEGMTLTTHEDGTTLIEGRVGDQAALHGLLRTLRDIGLPLLSVTQAAPPTQPLPTPTEPSQITPSQEKP